MEDRWEYYKNIMQQRFLTMDETLNEVMGFMSDTYNFRARYSPVSMLSKWSCIAESVDSKAQYERQFNKWKFRKNRKHPEWKFVHHRIAKRKRNGKESNLYIGGVLIPTKKIHKETSRHNFPTIHERYGQGNISHDFMIQSRVLKSSQHRVRRRRKDSIFARPQPFWPTIIC